MDCKLSFCYGHLGSFQSWAFLSLLKSSWEALKAGGSNILGKDFSGGKKEQMLKL